MTNLIVYGSLRKGHGNHRYLKESEFVGECEFPGVRRGPISVHYTDGDEMAQGEVYKVDDETLSRIDTLEGYNPNHELSSPYVRMKTTAILDSGEEIEGEVYYRNPRPKRTARS